MKTMLIKRGIESGNCYSLNEAGTLCKPLLNGKDFIEFLWGLKCNIPYGLPVENPYCYNSVNIMELNKDQALGICNKLDVCVTKVGMNAIISSALKFYHEKRTLN